MSECETEYLVFREVPTDRKTGVWQVRSKRHGFFLGTIKWYGAWRQYTFWPAPETIFNRGCLDDIKAFMGSRVGSSADEIKKSIGARS